ncbi:hypothetical protein FX743_09045 [Campylobacter coli]|uniref:hypothetical protein n=1 Tax=Campylobacter coli TaxID=195 RepID=UPI001C8C0497|nr:hypothetical protein [Campylobacter coli]ECO3446594.1 hypothetical protein [Campylobacter coli]ECO3447296.1 hypothetical protein [Campylobacter coli]MBX9215850.1 hypothetical protein [Campylobacter coli]MDN2807508.1 hypothetical protein [Campylobacter coli]MDP8550909.1 hypothetical protein [Campylobacter coli]
MQNSKPIGKSDDSSKEFIIRCLGGDKTYGFDIDSVYVYQNSINSKYYIFEYLKCDSIYVTPHTSDPNKYPYNWKKFHSLFQLTKKLGGTLILVNYSNGYDSQMKELPNKEIYENQVKMLFVEDIDYNAIKQYELSYPKPKYLNYLKYSDVKFLTLDEFSNILRQINSNCGNTKINLDRIINE